MGEYSKNTNPSVHMLASEWARGYRKFVCAVCRKKAHLLEPVINAIGHVEGAILNHMWIMDNIHAATLPSEEDIYEVHNLCKEWHAGQKKFVISLCLKNPNLLGMVMGFLNPQEGQDLLHMWMVDNLKLGANAPNV